MKREITKEALSLIAHFEGFYAHGYLDVAGIPTNGIGTIMYPNGQKVKIGDPPITDEKAYEYLMFELNEKADVVHNFLKKSNVLLNDQQYSALVSFAYNCGCGPIIDSGRSLCQALKSGNLKNIADAFLLYDKAHVKKWGITRVVSVAGLTRRRKSERHLFINGENNYFN